MSDPNACFEIPWHKSIVDRIKWRLIRFRRRWVPYLVWWGQEIDVCVTLSQDKLPDVSMSVSAGFPAGDLSQAFKPLLSGTFAEIEAKFREMGINFDTGMGADGRDWEWDWSLDGPIHIKFKGRATKPWRRRERPKPTLVFERPKAS